MYNHYELEAVNKAFKDLKNKFINNKLQSQQVLQLSRVIFELTTQIDIRSKVNLRRCLGSFRTSSNDDQKLYAYTLANLILDSLLEKNHLNQDAINDFCEQHLNKDKTGRQLALNDELRASEEMFLESLGTNLNEILIKDIKLKVSKITTSNDKLIRRFARSTNYLIQKLEDDNASQHDKEIAAAALNYLAEDFDIIPDEEGLIGLVDDMHVIRLAVELIDSSYSAVEHISDNTFECIPSFQDTFVSDGHIKAQISDYLGVSLNPAVTATKHFEELDYHLSTNFADEHIKFTTILMSFCMWQRESDADDLENFADHAFLSHDRFFVSETKDVGQFVEKVVIGDEIGYMFETLQLGNIEQRSKQFVPISKLHNFFPASKESNSRQTTSLRDKKQSVNFLNNLNTKQKSFFSFATSSKLFVLTANKELEDLQTNWALNGWRFGEVLPIAFLSKDLDLICSKNDIDPNFCKIIGVHDPDMLAEKCLENPEFVGENDIVVVNTERFKNKTASLKSLKNLFKSKIFVGDFLQELQSSESVSFEWPKKVLNAMSNIADISVPSRLEKRVYQFNNISLASHNAGKHEIIENLFETFNEIKNRSYLLEQEDKIKFQSAFKYFLSNSLKFWQTENDNELFDFCHKIAQLLSFYKGMFDLNINEELLNGLALHEKFVEQNQTKQQSFSDKKFTENSVTIKNLQELRDHILTDERNGVEELYLMFWPGRKQFKKLLLNCPHLKNINLFLFDHEMSWLETYTRSRNHSINPSDNQARLFAHRAKEADVAPDFQGCDPTMIESDFEATPSTMKVVFEDGFIYANNHTEFVLSQKYADNPTSYYSVTSEAICVGDKVVFIAPATKEELVEAQQAETYNHNLTVARNWQFRLRSVYFRQNFDFDNFVGKCRLHGLERHPATISNWVFDREMVAPRDYRTSLPLLNKIFDLGFSNLELEGMFSAIKVCHAQQHISGQQIAKEVKQRLISGNHTEADVGKIFARKVIEIQFVNEMPADALIGIFKKN